jgi:hypothetical protein
MHETENQIDADINELYRLLEKVSDGQFDIKGRLTRQGVRLDQIENGLREIQETQAIHGGRLAAILELLNQDR